MLAAVHRWFVGDPTPLACDNIFICISVTSLFNFFQIQFSIKINRVHFLFQAWPHHGQNGGHMKAYQVRLILFQNQQLIQFDGIEHLFGDTKKAYKGSLIESMKLSFLRQMSPTNYKAHS